MSKSYIFRVRLDQADLEQLERFAEATQRTKSQAVRAAISIMAQLFGSDVLPKNLTSQTVSESGNPS